MTTSTRHPLPPKAVLAFAMLLLASCAAKDAAPPAAPETYQTRGLVRQVSESPRSGLELLIHHEAISELKDDKGEVVGMEAMTMAFPVTDKTLAEGVAAGDKILFELEVSWNGSPPLRVTRIEKLPPDTELDF